MLARHHIIVESMTLKVSKSVELCSYVEYVHEEFQEQILIYVQQRSLLCLRRRMYWDSKAIYSVLIVNNVGKVCRYDLEYVDDNILSMDLKLMVMENLDNHHRYNHNHQFFSMDFVLSMKVSMIPKGYLNDMFVKWVIVKDENDLLKKKDERYVYMNINVRLFLMDENSNSSIKHILRMNYQVLFNDWLDHHQTVRSLCQWNKNQRWKCDFLFTLFCFIESNSLDEWWIQWFP